MTLCGHCKLNPIGPGRRKYCDACGPRASALWKASFRRDTSAQWRASGKAGSPPWLDYWPSPEARRAYYREYMKAWRARRKAGQTLASATGAVADRRGRRVFVDEAADENLPHRH